MYINRVKPENVKVMKILDMYALKGKGGFLNFKYAYTYFKLLSSKKDNSVVYTAYFDVPVQDIQSGLLQKGSTILVEKFGRDKFKYLGPNGDWETMLSFGIPADRLATLDAEFRNFSESVSLTYDEHTINGETTIDINFNNELIGKALIKDNKVFLKKYDNEMGKKLLFEWLESRGYNTSSLLTYDTI